MTSHGVVTLGDLEAMLKHCAPGYVLQAHGLHKLRVSWEGRVFPSLPCGERAKRRPEIQRGHVRRLVRVLGIEDCAATVLEFLR